MGSKYTSQTVSGFNSAPPSDDGSTASTNKVFWSTIKTKLADPLNTAIAAINSALVTATDYSARLVTSADSTVAGDHMRTLEVPSTVTATFTISLADAATMTNGYIVRVRNSSQTSITIGRASVGDTIDGAASNISIPPGSTVTLAVNAAANGYITQSHGGSLPAVILGGTVTSNGQSFSGTIANLGTVTTADINGGTLDGVVIGGSSAAAATVTTLTETTGAAWTTYTPTYSTDIGDAATSFTGTPTTTRAAYRILGKTLIIYIQANGTLKAITPGSINFTLPASLTSASSNQYIPSQVNDGATVGIAGLYRCVSGRIDAQKTSAAAWGSGNTFTLYGQFVFEVA